MNRSEMWETISETSMKMSVAGFKSHLTRNLKKARTSKQKTEVKNFWETKIQEYIDYVKVHNESVKRHNAAVKANRTRKSVKAETPYQKACKRSIRVSSR